MQTSQEHPLLKANILGAGFREDTLVWPKVVDAHRHKNVKIMPEKCLICHRVDGAQSTGVFQVERSIFVGKDLVGNRGFIVRNNPHMLILAAKD
jgi:hypothetical protein